MKTLLIFSLCISLLIHGIALLCCADTVLFDMGAYESKMQEMLHIDVGVQQVHTVSIHAVDENITAPEDTNILKKTINSLVDRKVLEKQQEQIPQPFEDMSLTDASEKIPNVDYAVPQAESVQDFGMASKFLDALNNPHVPIVQAGHDAAGLIRVPERTRVGEVAGMQTAMAQHDQVSIVRDDRVTTFFASSNDADSGFFVSESKDTQEITPVHAVTPIFQTVGGWEHNMTRVSVAKGALNVRGDMAEFLDVGCEVYALPDSSEQVVKVTLAVKDTAHMPTMAKDVLLLIDVSGSITARDIDSMREEVANVLISLNEQDRFNIVLFSVVQVQLYDEFQPVNENTIQKAQSFINRLQGVRQTNIYEALMRVVPFLKKDSRVTHVILMSDAKPTEGVMSFKKIINDFTRKRVSNVAFFAYDIGKVKDPFLLDYLAYENRGAAFHHNSEHGDDDGLTLAERLKDYQSPLLYDVRIDEVVTEQGELYPRLLQHLYHDKSAEVYIKLAQPGSVGFTLGATDMNGKRKGLNVAINTEGRPTSDNANIANTWAHYKLFELISVAFQEGMDDQLDEQIDALRKRYGIAIAREIRRYLK